MSILNPPEPVTVEYDCRGKRVAKTFPNAWEAKRFWIAKDQAGKRPQVRKEIKS